ncbi:MAG: hypothetical protein NVSMB8_08540 [Candidatus Limnocylindrales bacterium]
MSGGSLAASSKNGSAAPAERIVRPAASGGCSNGSHGASDILRGREVTGMPAKKKAAKKTTAKKATKKKK